MKTTPKSDALRAMREARFTGQRKSKPNLDALRAITKPAAPANIEDDMKKTKRKTKAKNGVARKARSATKKPTKKPAVEVTYGPAETVLAAYLRERARTRDQINAKMSWTDNTTRAAIAKLKAKVAQAGGALTKEKISGETFYRVA